MPRDLFISYSHQRDVPLASAVQKGMRRIGRKWYRKPALKVFRDTESLAASTDLAASILKELKQSTFFLCIASPEAAASPWVREELAFWRDHPDETARDRFLIALSDGTIAWDRAAGDFDWERTTALPREVLEGVFRTEPLWMDLRKFREADERSLVRGEFREKVVALAAAVHGCTKDELDSEDLRERRKFNFARNCALAVSVTLAVLAGLAFVDASAQRNVALARARTSASQALAARALDTVGKDPRKAAQFALYADAVRPTGESAQAMAQAVAANDSVSRHLQAGNEEVNNFRGVGHANATQVAISRDGGMLAYYSDFDPDGGAGKDQHIHLYDIRTGKALPHLKGKAWPQDGGAMAFSADGGILAVETPDNQVDIWDVPARRVLRTITATNGGPLAGAFKRLRAFAFSGDGQRLAAGFYSPGEQGATYHVAVWDVKTGRVLADETASDNSLALGFDPSGRLHALDHQAGTLRSLPPNGTVWGAARQIPGLRVPAGVAVSLSEDAGTAYVGENRNELWDLTAGRRVGGPGGEGAGALTMPGTKRVGIYAAYGKEVGVYDTALRRERVLGAFTWPVRSVSASGDGRWIAAGSQDGAVSLFSGSSVREGSPLTNAQQVRPGDLAVDQRTAFRTTGQATDVWAVTDQGVRVLGRLPLQLTRGAPQANTLAATPDGRRAVVSQGGTLSLWDVQAGRQLGIPAGGHPGFSLLTVLPDGQKVIGIAPQTIQVVDTGTWQVRQSLPYSGALSAAAAVSADRTTLAVVQDEALTVWRWTAEGGFRQVRKVSLKPVWTMYGHQTVVSNDGHRVAVRNFDGKLSVLDVPSGRIVHSTYASTGGPSMAFSTDSAFLVQIVRSGEQSALQFWDPDTGEARGTWTMQEVGSAQDRESPQLLPGGGGSVLSFAPDGSLVRRTVDLAAWHELLCDLAPGELPRTDYDRYLGGLDVARPCPRQ
ncbi:WD40 repeat protein [Streptomyces sp. Ag109_G2-6]|uniref:toll/interleukin-1 receptor domain-containing protein n=1 Tax=Streptomyces TaxID=1883 RepID=UPI0009A50692|nr:MULTISPECIES: TIR domain-containing protein [Streptomyces]RPF44973.1 WD40 repeat protein [Streptomyces sp. Ag109_G2-6]